MSGAIVPVMQPAVARCGEGFRSAWVAYECGPLAVTSLAVNVTDGRALVRRRVWAITHRPTGMKVCEGLSAGVARRLVHRLLPLLPWEEIGTAGPDKSHPNLHRAAELIEEFGAYRGEP